MLSFTLAWWFSTDKNNRFEDWRRALDMTTSDHFLERRTPVVIVVVVVVVVVLLKKKPQNGRKRFLLAAATANVIRST